MPAGHPKKISRVALLRSAVARKIGSVETAEDFLRTRAEGATADDLSRFLDKAPDIAPESEDELSGG